MSGDGDQQNPATNGTNDKRRLFLDFAKHLALFCLADVPLFLKDATLLAKPVFGVVFNANPAFLHNNFPHKNTDSRNSYRFRSAKKPSFLLWRTPKKWENTRAPYLVRAT